MNNNPSHRTLSVRLKAFLLHRRLPLFAALLGMLLAVPTLWSGGGPSDDILQRSFIQSSSLGQVLTRLFVFLDPAMNAARMDAGYFPWWTYEQARIIFFRPLAAFSMWLDYQLWPNSSLLMHLHSLVIYGFLCWVAALLFRRLMGTTLQSGLAAVLFALSTAHVGALVSLAARNLLMTTAFGVLTLLFYDRRVRAGWRPAGFLALACLLLSLLSAETGVASCTYLLAYALFVDERSLRIRLLSLLPYAVLAGVWLLLYQFFGFGALGSGFYISPMQEPFRFLIAIFERVPFLLMGQWILPDPVVYTALSDGARVIFWVLCTAVLGYIVLLLKPLLLQDRLARFWMLGMLLSVLPVCAVSPASGRHLTFISLGAFALMAMFIVGRLAQGVWVSPTRGWCTAALVMSILFLVLHVGVYPVAGFFVRPVLDGYAVAVTDIGAPPALESQDVILLNAPSPSLFMYLPTYRQYTSQPLPAHLRVLAPGFSAVYLTVLDEHTLIIQPEQGFLFSPENLDLDGTSFLPLFHSSHSFQYGDSLFRSPQYPLELGGLVDLTGVSIEVIALTEEGLPEAARVRFDLPLADASLLWLCWDWESARYVPVTLPPAGETLFIPGPY